MNNYEKAMEIYEKHGQFAVHDAAVSGQLQVDRWAYCSACEIESPIEDGVCLVCGEQNEIL